MKNLLLIILVALFTIDICAQSDWDTYRSRAIATLVKQEQEIRSKTSETDVVISGEVFPSRTVVTYLGSKRRADKYARTFVKLWADSRHLPPENADLLVDEYLFRENGIEYWLPVIKSTAETIDKEFKTGEEISIYYFYLGGFDPVSLNRKDTEKQKPTVDDKSPFRWIFAVEKFERPRPPAFASRSLDSLIDDSKGTSDVITDIWFDPRQLKAQARLAFTGDTRDISGKRKELLELWLERNGLPRSASALMSKEARFLDGETEYWIGMRNTTLNEIVSGVKRGDSLLLNTILAGGVRTKDGIDWFFVAGQYVR
jgi:hypothetical protein